MSKETEITQSQRVGGIIVFMNHTAKKSLDLHWRMESGGRMQVGGILRAFVARRHPQKYNVQFRDLKSALPGGPRNAQLPA